MLSSISKKLVSSSTRVSISSPSSNEWLIPKRGNTAEREYSREGQSRSIKKRLLESLPSIINCSFFTHLVLWVYLPVPTFRSPVFQRKYLPFWGEGAHLVSSLSHSSSWANLDDRKVGSPVSTFLGNHHFGAQKRRERAEEEKEPNSKSVTSPFSYFGGSISVTEEKKKKSAQQFHSRLSCFFKW